MLPSSQRFLFILFALFTLSLSVKGFYRLYRRIAAGRKDTDARLDHLPRRLWYALTTTLTQSRVFRKRRVISVFHSLIFYGFAFYVLVNVVDGMEGFIPFSIRSIDVAGALYNLLADLLSAAVLIGVIALVIRRFLLPSRRDFRFNDRTLLHKDVGRRYIMRDSVIVSVFILFHVGSRTVGAAAKIAAEGPDRFQPFASSLAHLISPQNAEAWRIFGYWGALGSVLAFLAYFPYSKHIHIFMAPAKYLVARPVMSGVLPAVAFDTPFEGEAEAAEEQLPQLRASKLEDLAWPRLLDAYACIQCNRCQDVCPATATGKALSPSALEINKRMELNELTRTFPAFESGSPSPNPLLSFAISAEAAWACTTCGACLEVCPVQDEPMLDIIDIRRQQVMIEGEFPSQLQNAFRGMERAQNPWGISRDKRMDWADGLNVKTTDENPEPDVLFWVGCAAAYDPQSQKTARAFVQLLDHAGVDFAVLGKRECCTGDSARRAGNEYLYRQLAEENVATLDQVKPKLVVATCPHCMNAIGKEYKQLGGDYKVLHHTEYLESLVRAGKLDADAGTASVAFHDPCYLGRHNGIYDAPRNLLKILSNDVVELPRNRENAFCCGAGGAQFWKEEEPGSERISDNRYREAKTTLAAAGEKVLAVGCPFCKSMLDSTPGKGSDDLAVKDIAVLLLEGVERRAGKSPGRAIAAESTVACAVEAPHRIETTARAVESLHAVKTPALTAEPAEPVSVLRKKWPGKPALTDTAQPLLLETSARAEGALPAAAAAEAGPGAEVVTDKRKKWSPKKTSESVSSDETPTPRSEASTASVTFETNALPTAPPLQRKVWKPKSAADSAQPAGEAEAPPSLAVPDSADTTAKPRKLWKPKN